MDFREALEGLICIDAMEHVYPEDWPGIWRGIWEALKPGGVLYFTLDLADANELEEAFEQAKSRGLPVVLGELVSDVDLANECAKVSGMKEYNRKGISSGLPEKPGFLEKPGFSNVYSCGTH